MDETTEKAVITIIGLGQVGTSIGLALQPFSERVQRIGHTRKFGEGNHAKSIDALDKVAINLPGSVRKADVVILAIPMHELKDVLGYIAPELKEGAVVLDTSPVPSVATKWGEEALPEGRFFVSFTPVLNPKNISGPEHGIQSAKADLFKDGLFVITSGMLASSDALKVAADLATMMQASPLFADSAEIDSYMASTHLLPQLIAASLVKVTQEAPGWGESRKIAGRPYAQVTNLLNTTDRARSLALSAAVDKQHVLRVMDNLIEDMQTLRAQIAEEDGTEGKDSPLAKRLEEAREDQEKWFDQRQQADWVMEREALDVQLTGGMFGQMFGTMRPRTRRRKEEEK